MSMYPTVRPSLTLDFQKSKQLDPRISFSRSSSATYVEGGVIKYADEHQARFEEEGLLIEEARTNLILNTSTPNASNWDLLSGGATPVSSTSTAPDGSTGCIRIQSSVATGGGKRLFNPAATGTHICSVYARSRTGVAQNVDCTLSSTSSTITTTLPADGSWIRVISDATDVPAITGKTFGIRASDSSGCDIDVWGEQAEKGSFETSFIPTSGSTVTRAADVCTITGDNFSSWYNNSEGTMLADVGPSLRPGDAVYLGTNNNRVMVNGTINLNLQVNGTNANTNIQHTNVVDGNPIKFAYAIKPGDYAFAVKGVNKTGSNNTINSVAQMTIGRNIAYGGTNRLNGCVARLSYYPERLTNEQLEAITS